MSFWRDLLGRTAKKRPRLVSHIPDHKVPSCDEMSQRELSQERMSGRRQKARRLKRKRVQTSRRKNRGTKRKT